MNKCRRKPCRHCLFTKNALGTKDDVDYERAQITQNGDIKFFCHEHSDAVFCNGFFKRYPERIKGPMQMIQENGDRKHEFSNMTREIMGRCQMVGLKCR